MASRDLLFNLSVDMLCIANGAGYFVDVNAAFTRTLGYGREELLSQPFVTFVHPDDAPRTEAELVQVRVGLQTLHFENRYRHKEGHYLTLSWSSYTDQDSGLVYAVARDITEQVEVRNRLLQIERALDQGMLVAVLDPHGVIISVNDGLCHVSGYSRQELVGRSLGEFRSELHPDELLRDIAHTTGSGKIWSGTLESRSKSGDLRVARTLVAAVVDHAGVLSRYVTISQDVTESVHNEEALARTVGILNETNSIARVGGWELDVETEELEWTDETFRILEVEKKKDRKPILPEGLKLFTPDSQPIIERAVSRAIEFGEPYSLELEAQTAKGNVLWVYTNGKANYENGKVVTLSGTIQDIHARKLAELRYEEEHRRVMHEAKMASLGELAASMAHELNNPLGIASGYAELALESPDLTPDLRQKLERILKSCDRMAHIVTKLRAFSRTEQRSERATRALAEIIREAVTLVDSRLKSERVRLTFESESTAEVSCSEIEIEQVFVNLLNNAIDAVSEQSERWIIIELVERPLEVEVRVMDSGAGVPEVERERMFEPFFSTKTADQGTGLGLPISREILEVHGGRLVYDPDRKNTCFVLTLPRPQAPTSGN